ncbi:HSP40/DnaJ peptide-binding protein [Euphorbia peplus]|nr:HSP40/DnaJ peptide-binding protein [Euphorbia peplus]
MVHHHHQIIPKPIAAVSIPDQRKKTCSLGDFCRIYLTAITRWCCLANSFPPSSKSSSSPKPNRSSHDSSNQLTTISDSHVQDTEEETEDEKETMKEVYNNDESLRGNNLASTSDRYFKYKSVDNVYPQYVSSPVSRNESRRGPPSPSFLYKSKSRGSIDSHHGLSRNESSRKSTTTPIMFSNSTGLIKPAPLHKLLECSLEELCFGCTKKIKVTRDVLTNTGQIIQEEELLTISVKPGWKKGTKVTFEGMGNERPGSLPADITFIISEKKHPLFRREGDNLELTIEIPLIKALTSSEISIPLLDGDNFSMMIEDIIYPGYYKLIQGEGMPSAKDNGKRGDLKVIFLVEFPSELTEDQRLELVSILEDSGSG